MKAGYTKAWRKELNSDIWQMPPLYQRVWFWIRQKAMYSTSFFPTRRAYGIWLQPGQMLTSLDHIARGVAWREHGVERVPNRKTIKAILDWMAHESNRMVIVESNANGTYITVINWHTYQSRDDEKVTLAGLPSIHSLDTLKEGKEVKERKEVKDKDKNEEAIKPLRAKRAPKATDEEFLIALKSSRAYQGIDIDHELAKMDIWFMTDKGHGRKKTRAFILSWLGKAEKTITHGAQSGTSRHTGLDKKDYHAGLEDFYPYGKDVL